MSTNDHADAAPSIGNRASAIALRYLEEEPVGTIVSLLLVLLGLVGAATSFQGSVAISAVLVILLVPVAIIAIRQRWANPWVDIGFGALLGALLPYLLDRLV